MEFRLIYRGSLPSASRSDGRTREKHTIRKQFHKQLRELWKQHPDLRAQAGTKYIVSTITPGSVMPPPSNFPDKLVHMVSDQESVAPNVKTWLEHVADTYQRCGGRFVPIVRREGGLTCALDILFLRRDNPGGVIDSGGDIDNRIKVLFDGLKMPATVPDLGGMPIGADENPFFCLLEDDSLVTSVSITTDRLLTPQEDTERVHDVCLIIHVTVVNPSALFLGGRLV